MSARYAVTIGAERYECARHTFAHYAHYAGFYSIVSYLLTLTPSAASVIDMTSTRTASQLKTGDRVYIGGRGYNATYVIRKVVIVDDSADVTVENMLTGDMATLPVSTDFTFDFAYGSVA